MPTDTKISDASKEDYPKDDLLRLSDMYRSAACTRWTKNHIIHKHWKWHATELIDIAMKYGDRDFFEHGFRALIKLPARELTSVHLASLNPTVLAASLKIQDAIRTHTLIVAAEPPPITEHSADCGNTTACAADWHAVWWNGMARYLLDGRNPLQWEDAFHLFERMEFGDMAKGCKQTMLMMVKDGSAMSVPIYHLTNRATKQVLNLVLPEF
jgi:hypothetical protein